MKPGNVSDFRDAVQVTYRQHEKLARRDTMREENDDAATGQEPSSSPYR
jgi:hypothetical protein